MYQWMFSRNINKQKVTELLGIDNYAYYGEFDMDCDKSFNNQLFKNVVKTIHQKKQNIKTIPQKKQNLEDPSPNGGRTSAMYKQDTGECV